MSGATATTGTGGGPDLYIVIPNWSRFQHYKDRDPKWIKNYTRLLVDDDYLGLSATRRALLHGLWMVYAQTATSEGLAEDLPETSERLAEDLSRTCLRLDVKMLNRRLGLAAKMSDYESLNHAGFIDIVASKSLAHRYQVASNTLASRYQVASAELEVEVEKENPNPKPKTSSYDARANGSSAASADPDDIPWDDLDALLATAGSPPPSTGEEST